PPPYGNGGGEATSHIDDPISNHELIGIWQGGIEIHPLINRELSLRWMTEKRIDYRQASLYFWSFQIMTTYVQDTVEDLNDGVDDNDPRAYIRLLNAEAGIADPEDFIMTVGDLKSKMNLDLLNPFAIYSMWTILKTYLWNGDVSNKLFCLNLGEVRYLPSLRTGLTPFGIQYHLENYFRYRQMVGLIDVSLGDQTFYNSWGGLGILVQNVYEKDRLSLNLKCDFWDQPQLRLGENADPLSESKTGGAVSVRVYYDLPGTTYPWAAVFEAGYKSEGFLEGYAFDASPVLLIGVAIRN
ncbi:MAG: hypothetical protein H8D46_02540, partial [FCB group bacterium]|nr:hypothetical protein [FCB group bacterium]